MLRPSHPECCPCCALATFSPGLAEPWSSQVLSHTLQQQDTRMCIFKIKCTQLEQGFACWSADDAGGGNRAGAQGSPGKSHGRSRSPAYTDRSSHAPGEIAPHGLTVCCTTCAGCVSLDELIECKLKALPCLWQPSHSWAYCMQLVNELSLVALIK